MLGTGGLRWAHILTLLVWFGFPVPCGRADWPPPPSPGTFLSQQDSWAGGSLDPSRRCWAPGRDVPQALVPTGRDFMDWLLKSAAIRNYPV